MNELFVLLGIESWKPVVTALVLPPVPFLLMALVGARLILPRRGWGWATLLLGVVGIWFSACTATGRFLEEFVADVPPAMRSDRMAQLKSDPKARSTTAIVVLGGGAEGFAPEYGVSNLKEASLERLRYGIWLSRETGVPLAFSGGEGWASKQGVAEAEVAARIAAKEFNHPLRWTESQSRDTRQNAGHSVALLRQPGVKHIIVVTHGWHMPRALRAFKDAAAPASMSVEGAPLGLSRSPSRQVLNWLPSSEGYERVRNNLRELIGRLMGA